MDMASVWMSRELRKQLKIVAATEERDLTVVLNEAVTEYLDRRRHASISRVQGDSDRIKGANE
jgi:predicted transcriptional regulator